MRLRGYEISLAGDGELGFQTKELAFRGAVQLPLFRSGVSSIAVGDGTGGRQCAQHELVGDDDMRAHLACKLERRRAIAGDVDLVLGCERAREGISIRVVVVDNE